MKVTSVLSQEPPVLYGEHAGKAFYYDGHWRRLEVVDRALVGDVAPVPADLLAEIASTLEQS